MMLEYGIQEFPTGTDERFAISCFLRTWRLPYESDLGFGRSI
jgi:hypothetical protein